MLMDCSGFLTRETRSEPADRCRRSRRGVSRTGITAGDVLMVHASMRRVGPVERDAVGMVDALREAVGVRGSLLMVLSADESEPPDALRSPVDGEDMGVLAEVFHTYPGVALNDHPANRYAAIGPAAVRRARCRMAWSIGTRCAVPRPRGSRTQARRP